jgi:hypothetical protein
MKLRMLFLAAALVAFSSVSFGQSIFSFIWANGISNNWTELTYCDDPVGPTLQDGTIVKMYRETFLGDFYHFDAQDVPCVAGTDGAAGQVSPVVEFPFNSAAQVLPLGSFVSPNLEFVGVIPADFYIYLVIGCYDDQGVFHPMYATGCGYIITGSYTEVYIHDPAAAGSGYALWKFPVGSAPAWIRLGCCEPPVSCEGTPSPFDIQAGEAGTHADNEFERQAHCVYLCPGVDLVVNVGDTWEPEIPVLFIEPGCELGVTHCDEICDPAVFTVQPGVWTPYVTGGLVGYWPYVIHVEVEGCACIYLDDILAAEMGSIDIVARDNAVELTWNTLSESNLSHFSITRDSHEIAQIEANNSASSYTYTDGDVRNGVTYSYTLSSVDVNGTVRVLATESVTPSINAVGTITEYALHQNFPNPFNPTTNIIFDVVNENHVELTVYNAMGQTVSTLVNGTFGNGRHNVEFSSDNLTSGLYFYTVKVGNEFTATKKMLLVK